jgi:hypothetical protein
MPTKDDVDPIHALPLFLSGRIEEQKIGNARSAVVTSSRVFKASALIAAAVGIAFLLLGNSVPLFANVAASLIGNWGVQPGTTPTIQSTADPAASIQSTADDKTLPQTSVQTGNEIAASEPAGEDQTEKSKSTSEALFRQFRVWAEEQDGQANVGPLVQDAMTQFATVARNARLPNRLIQQRRDLLPAHNARAGTPRGNIRKKVRRASTMRVRRPTTEDGRTQGHAVQSARLVTSF